jgi:hypothetical protein
MIPQIFSIYILSVAASYKFIKISVNHNNESILTDSFLAALVAICPIFNFYIAFDGFKTWVKIRAIIKILKKLYNTTKDEKIDNIIKSLQEMINP